MEEKMRMMLECSLIGAADFWLGSNAGRSKQSRRVQIVGLRKPNDCCAPSPLVYIGFYWFALVYIGLQKPKAGCEANLIITVLQ